MKRSWLLTLVALVGWLVAAPGLTAAPHAAGATPEAEPAPAVLVGAGDIASCDDEADEATAKLLDVIEGTVFTLGDNAYPDGSARQFAECYEPTWGRHKDRTRPAAGNHDYETENAAAYFDYFGEAAGDPETGYYSYDLGAWHVVVLNSNCDEIGGCDAGSDQERWLRDDLAAHPAACTVAYWHHPRFSSGKNHGDEPEVAPLWDALYDAGADVILAGHDHLYERFAPQDADGDADPARGIRSFVVGTGGKDRYRLEEPRPNSEVRDDDTHGVLVVMLHPTGYDWSFRPIAGQTFHDEGTAACH